jgi:Fic family protein
MVKQFGLLPYELGASANRVVSDLDDLKQQLDARGPLVIGWEGQLRRDLQAAAVHASVAMEGVPVTVEEVRRILAGDRPSTIAVEDAELVEGYRDAMLYVQARADDPVFEWSSELIKAIHHRVVAGRRDLGAGRYGNARYLTDEQTGELIYTPPQENVEDLVEEMCQELNAGPDANAPHVAAQAAWVHVAFAAIHPFKDGNGRTARVLASLAMYRGGFRRPEFCSLEEWWGRHKVEYYAAFACLGKTFERDADVTPFIKIHLEAQRSQVRALALREETNRQLWVALGRACAGASVPDRAAFALWDAYNGRPITRPYYRAVTDISDAAASLDFAALRASGLLQAEGRTRGRFYVAGARLFSAIARELELSDADHADRDVIVNELTRRVGQNAPRGGSLETTSSGSLFPAHSAPPVVVRSYPDRDSSTRTS